jgi:F-type H+-transporting ATPase subunit b
MDILLGKLLHNILIPAIPTFLLVIVLHFYLKLMFFNPLGKVLHQRYEATEGARKLAEESLERATKKTAEYEAAMRAARAEVYQAQEKVHKQLQEREATELAEARRRAEALIQQARAALAQDVEAAKVSLHRDSQALAGRIAAAVLRSAA